MKEIVILIGNIGSGKSTLAKKYQAKGYIVISRDMLRYSIGGGNYVYNEKYEPIIWRTELYLFESFLLLNTNIVVDEIGLSVLLRSRYIKLAQSFGYKIKAIVLPRLTMEESIKRRLTNNHGTTDKSAWEEVWKKFDIMYEVPTLKEGFNQIIYG